MTTETVGVPRELLERLEAGNFSVGERRELRAILAQPVVSEPVAIVGLDSGRWKELLRILVDLPEGTKLYRHPPAPAVPEGYALVPKEIHLSASVIELINGMCGDGNEESGYGPYQDGTLFVGHAVDDNGEKVYGLHLFCDECPEEGVTTLAEFTAMPQPTEESTND